MKFFVEKYENAARRGQAPRRRSGQVMIITILVLGGAILSATTIAGLLMLYQIRQTTDIANSGKAIYAADAGIEWALYTWFCTPSKGNCGIPLPSGAGKPAATLSNGATIVVEKDCYDINGDLLVGSNCTATSSPYSVRFRSVGTAGNSTRALGLSF